MVTRLPMARLSKTIPNSGLMAALPVAAGFSAALCPKRERTWHGVAIPMGMSALAGALRGLRTGTFFIIVPPLILKASRGPSARNISGGTRNTIMGIAQKGVGLGTMCRTFLRRSLLLLKLTQWGVDWMRILGRIHLQ